MGLRAGLPRPPKAGLRTGLNTGLKRVCLDTMNRVLDGILLQTAKPRWTGTFPPQAEVEKMAQGLIESMQASGRLLPVVSR